LFFTLALHALLGEPVQDGPALVAEGPARVVGVDFPGVGQRTPLSTHHTAHHKQRRRENPAKFSHAKTTENIGKISPSNDERKIRQIFFMQRRQTKGGAT